MSRGLSNSGIGKELASLVYAQLTTHADSSAVFGSRIFPIIAPMGTKYPLAVYRRANVDTPASLGGTVERPVVSLEVKVYDKTYTGVLDAAKAIRKALNGFRGTQAGCTVQRTTFQREQDGAEIPQDAQQLPDFTVTQTYELRVEDASA